MLVWTDLHSCIIACTLCVVALQVRTEIQRNYEDWKLFNAVRITAEFLGKLVYVLGVQTYDKCMFANRIINVVVVSGVGT